ncbi:helix-turn-helix domain-containing protein [Halarchaeum sp. P4]|uniref:helix-turn-helix domain-containing protein n=1 Tax=Halarchaeum sp. P4 TaxID=3421639 RepID=UPI003EBCBEE0
MHRVTLDLWQDDCPLSRASADHDVAFTTPYWNFTPETGRWELWVEATAEDRSHLEAGVRALRDAETMKRFELSEKRPRRATMRVRFAETAAITAVTAHGGAVVGPFANYEGRERWRLGFTDRDAVDDALTALDGREEFDVVDRTALTDAPEHDVYEHLEEAAALVESCRRLTDTERRVLRSAVEAGYYETPRNVTLADLAEHHGVSDVAVSKTLRRAERRLLDAAVDATDGLRGGGG